MSTFLVWKTFFKCLRKFNHVSRWTWIISCLARFYSKNAAKPKPDKIENAKIKTDIDKISGVYKLKCGSCLKTYIGHFKLRRPENYRELIKKGGWNYAKHLLKNNHQFNVELYIIHIQEISRKLI